MCVTSVCVCVYVCVCVCVCACVAGKLTTSVVMNFVLYTCMLDVQLVGEYVDHMTH